MSYYYEFELKFTLKKETPYTIRKFLNTVINEGWDKYYADIEPVLFNSPCFHHHFFLQERWISLLKCYYVHKEGDPKKEYFTRPDGYHYLTISGEINKGYSEIQTFIDWLAPWVVGRKKHIYIGWCKGENWESPRIDWHVPGAGWKPITDPSRLLPEISSYRRFPYMFDENGKIIDTWLEFEEYMARWEKRALDDAILHYKGRNYPTEDSPWLTWDEASSLKKQKDQFDQKMRPFIFQSKPPDDDVFNQQEGKERRPGPIPLVFIPPMSRDLQEEILFKEHGMMSFHHEISMLDFARMQREEDLTLLNRQSIYDGFAIRNKFHPLDLEISGIVQDRLALVTRMKEQMHKYKWLAIHPDHVGTLAVVMTGKQYYEQQIAKMQANYGKLPRFLQTTSTIAGIIDKFSSHRPRWHKNKNLTNRLKSAGYHHVNRKKIYTKFKK